MKNIIWAIALLIIISFQTADAKNAGGVNFPEYYKIDDNNFLSLNGAGFLKKFMIKIYGNSLYLKNKSHDPQKIIEADEMMSMRMVIIYDSIKLRELTEGLRDGFNYSNDRDEAKVKPLLPRIETFLGYFTRNPKKYDTATFLYIPGQGTHININGEYKGLIPGLDFKKSLFGIWLCEKPANRDLKKELLDLD